MVVIVHLTVWCGPELWAGCGEQIKQLEFSLYQNTSCCTQRPLISPGVDSFCCRIFRVYFVWCSGTDYQCTAGTSVSLIFAGVFLLFSLDFLKFDYSVVPWWGLVNASINCFSTGKFLQVDGICSNGGVQGSYGSLLMIIHNLIFWKGLFIFVQSCLFLVTSYLCMGHRLYLPGTQTCTCTSTQTYTCLKFQYISDMSQICEINPRDRQQRCG